MKEKASDAKVKFLGGHVEALVKETISCGVSRGEVIELFLTYWEKEQKKILESKEQLKKKEERNEKLLSYPMEEFIKNAIRQNVCKSLVFVHAKHLFADSFREAVPGSLAVVS